MGITAKGIPPVDFDDETPITINDQEAALAALADFSRPPHPLHKGANSLKVLGSGRGFAALATLAGEYPQNDPMPLPPDLPEGGDFPVSILNGRFGAAVRAFQNIIQCPIGVCANTILAMGSVVFQGYHDVYLPKDRRRPISLFIVTVAVSGERKSTADDIAKKPLKQRQDELKVQYEADYKKYYKSLKAYESEERAILSKVKGRQAKDDALNELGDKPVEPLDYKLFTEDWTLEGIVKQLSHGQPSSALMTDEGGRILGGHSMKSENRVATVSGLSKLWDGADIDRCRAGDAKRIEVRKHRVSSHIMVQPDIAVDIFSDTKVKSQGMFARMLISRPQSTCGERLFRESDAEALRTIEEFQDFLLENLRRPLPIIPGTLNELDPSPLPFDDDATEAWIKFFNNTEKELKPGGRYRRHSEWVSKAGEHVGRIAAVLTLLEDPDATSIPLGRMLDAIELGWHYLNEYVSILEADYSSDITTKDARDILDWLTGMDDDGKPKWGYAVVSPADIVQRSPVRHSVRVKAAVDKLESSGLLKRVPGKVMVGNKMRERVYEVVKESVDL